MYQLSGITVNIDAGFRRLRSSIRVELFLIPIERWTKG
jgi:hypothetical protein